MFFRCLFTNYGIELFSGLLTATFVDVLESENIGYEKDL